MFIYEVPGAKKQITEIISSICQGDLDGLQGAGLIDDDRAILGMQEFLSDYLSNPKNTGLKLTPPPEDEIGNAQTRTGWSDTDVLADVALWGNGEEIDITAIFRIKIDKNTSTVKLYDIGVL